MAIKFTSPGAAMTEALFDFLTQRETKQRQDMLDEITVDREKRLAESATANTEVARQNAASIAETRKANASLAEENLKTKRVERAAKTYRPGDVLPAANDVPEELRQKQQTLPGRTLPMTTGVPGVLDAPSVAPQTMPQEATGRETFTGTPAQTAIEALLREPKLTDAQRSAVRLAQATGDFSGLAQLFKTPEQDLEVRSAGGALFERQADGSWKQVAQGPTGDNAAKPFYTPIQTAQGILSFDGRTGKVAGRIGDLKPGETAQKELANGQTIMWMMDQMTANMTPEKIGPIMGRFKSVEEAIVGGDDAFSALASQTAQLQNVVINLRTGAAMSEPEAARILAELPSVKLPPPTFLARLKNAQGYYREWQRNRANIAYGRTTAGDVDRMVTPETAPTPAPPTDDPAAKARALIEAARKRRQGTP